MNKYTKKSLIFSILAFAVIIAGILVFCFAAYSISESSKPPESDDSGAQFGHLITIIGGLISLIIVVIVDAVLSSLFVYAFSYFSHENALLALEEGGENSGLAKTLLWISKLGMVFSAIIALTVLLMMMLVLARAAY